MPTGIADAIDQHLERFRRVRLRTVEMIASLAQQDLDFVPAPGRWSAGESVDHIILAADSLQHILEELVRLKRSGQRPFLNLTFADIDISFAFVPKSLMPVLEMPLLCVSRFIPSAMRNFLIENRVLPFRAARGATPRHGIAKQELSDRLLTSFDSVNSVFQDNADLHFQEMLAEHPLFGHVVMSDLPGLMVSHELRHQKQIADVLAARSKTGPIDEHRP